MIEVAGLPETTAPSMLKDSPPLIQAVFPAQKVSFEAQSERKAVAAQTLTGLGSYWKGRKPLILVRAIVLGSLLPQTDDSEKDLEIFEKLMAFDDHGLARRALAQNDLKPKQIAACINLSNPWSYFSFTGSNELPANDRLLTLECPFDAEKEGISIRWARDISEDAKLQLIEKVLAELPTYEEKAGFCKRPEDVHQEWLYRPIWPEVNAHLAPWGIKARRIEELVEHLGNQRYGHRPRVGDVFAGGGSIPFEAARLGCDVFASDLNPVASMLAWSALNLAGLPPAGASDLDEAQDELARNVGEKLSALDINEDKHGNQAKAFLYCLETRCPETGWLVPVCPSWVISKSRRTIARPIPNHREKRFDIQVVMGVSRTELKNAERGTVQGRELVYELDGMTYRTPIKTIRGEYRDADGVTKNRLRLWDREDFEPRPDDVFQERLYAIQWFSKESLHLSRRETFFSTVSAADQEREQRISRIVRENLVDWQARGLIPDMPIETGKENEGPIRTNGWTHWHHMFTPRNLLIMSVIQDCGTKGFPQLLPLIVSKFADNNSKSCRWATSQSGGDGGAKSTFDSQALKTIFNWANRSFAATPWRVSVPRFGNITSSTRVECLDARDATADCDLFITDPPYADAVHYHEITEFFIAWIRKHTPPPFDQWVWDSRRVLAIKGSGDEFRRGVVDAYRAMADHMPDNGMQCVMFTHQDTGVWSDMVGIFWAAGLQVVAAWYIATETSSELKKGGYVQGTVILMLRQTS